MKYLSEFIALLEKLEHNNIYYKLNKIRDNSLMIEVAVPGERWEIELVSYDNEKFNIEIEKFKSNGEITSTSELDILFNLFKD